MVVCPVADSPASLLRRVPFEGLGEGCSPSGLLEGTQGWLLQGQTGVGDISLKTQHPPVPSAPTPSTKTLTF